MLNKLIILFMILSNAQHEIAQSMNVFGEKLELCCSNPKTGFYRDGFCNTGSSDYGTHVVCSVMTKEFLEFSKSKGNDLSTPNCLLYTSPSPRDATLSRMPSSA